MHKEGKDHKKLSSNGMPSINKYHEILNELVVDPAATGVLAGDPYLEWDTYLGEHCGLPGPRANLELAWAVARLGTPALFQRYLGLDCPELDGNSPQDYLVICAVLGQGELLAAGERTALDIVQRFANDRRWRMREAAAMALQRWGDADMPALLGVMQNWAQGSLLEQRAVVAGLCEPRLLKDACQSERVLEILDEITASLLAESERKNLDFRTLRQALGYCWSVAICASPRKGKTLFEKWATSTDPDMVWIVRENLTKKRLQKLDAEWVDRTRSEIAG